MLREHAAGTAIVEAQADVAGVSLGLSRGGGIGRGPGWGGAATEPRRHDPAVLGRGVNVGSCRIGAADAGEAVGAIGRFGDGAGLLAEDHSLGAAERLARDSEPGEAAEDEQRDRLAEIVRRPALRAHQGFGDVAVGANAGGGEVGCRDDAVGLQLRAEHRQIQTVEPVCGVGGQQQHGVVGFARPTLHVRGARIPGIELGAGDLGVSVETVSWRPKSVARPARRRRHGLVGVERGVRRQWHQGKRNACGRASDEKAPAAPAHAQMRLGAERLHRLRLSPEPR